MEDVEIVSGAAPTSREELLAAIREYLRGTKVERAIVFGSWARGQQDLASDLDLALIEETQAPFVERGRAHLPLFRLGVGVDLFVYTPAEYARLLRAENPLVTGIEREGVVVHVRSSR